MPVADKEAIWDTKGADKRTAVQRMFSEIAPSYDHLNGLMSLALHHRWRARAVSMLSLQRGDCVLDVCCGTGDFFKPLKRAVGHEGHVFGMDFALPMLQVAQIKQVGAISLGDACCLPVRSESCDAATVGWGIRNVPDIDAAHRELFRVLRTGGRVVSIDMAIPQNGLCRSISQLGMRLLPKVGSLFGHRNAYTYLPESTHRFWSRERLCASMRGAGFVEVQTKDLFFGNICIHLGRKP